MSMTQTNPTRPTPRRTFGFTLVELLVVIGIIAVLVGILLPALGRGKANANNVKCMGNLRTIGQALHLYVTQNKGLMPFGFVTQNAMTDGGVTYTGPATDWTLLLLGLLNKRGSDYSEQPQTGIGDAGLRAIFLCPEAFRESTSKAFITQYSAHPRLLPDLRGNDYSRSGTALLRSYKMSQIKNAAEKVIIFDASLANTTWMAFACANTLDRNVGSSFVGLQRRPYLVEDRWSDSPIPISPNDPVGLRPNTGTDAHINTDAPENAANLRFRHSKDTRLNALMLDGHVETFAYNPASKTTDMRRKNIYVAAPR